MYLLVICSIFEGFRPTFELYRLFIPNSRTDRDTFVVIVFVVQVGSLFVLESNSAVIVF